MLYGPWGTYIHVPKCGGVAIKEFLRKTYGVKGEDVGENHSYLTSVEGAPNPWTAIRHPAEWLLSYFAYYETNGWRWEDLPIEVDKQFKYANGAFWPFFVKMVCERNPGAVGKVFDLYCIDGVTVHHLENINDVMGDYVPVKHTQDIKPVMTDEHWQMICEAEKETLERYGYSNQR
jgi:hypothetical protein